MYHVSAQGVDERMINVHYYYYWHYGGVGAGVGGELIAFPYIIWYKAFSFTWIGSHVVHTWILVIQTYPHKSIYVLLFFLQAGGSPWIPIYALETHTKYKIHLHCNRVYCIHVLGHDPITLYNHPYALNHTELINWTFHNYEVNIFKVLAIIYHRFHVGT